MKKTFLISIDAEGDNLWNWQPGQEITTENAKYVARFQALCEKYGFKPTYLTNYEISCNPDYVDIVKPAAQDGRCEVGMHLHAWNSPPNYELPVRKDILPGECAYLIEYPTDVMDEKIKFMTEHLENIFGTKPVVHRAGRWAMDARYFSLLNKYGYLADCSVAPGMDMRSARGFTDGGKGSDYTQYSHTPYIVENTDLIEIPMTVMMNHQVKKVGKKNIKQIIRSLYKALCGRGMIWLRPNGHNLQEMLYIARKTMHSRAQYLMFMLHTSEMMPNGSPTFKTSEEIEQLYADLDVLFSYVSKHYVGMTIGEYARELRKM